MPGDDGGGEQAGDVRLRVESAAESAWEGCVYDGRGCEAVSACDASALAAGGTMKARWAVGTTSRAPDGRHYLMLDVDRRRLPGSVLALLSSARRSLVLRTHRGWHVYTDRKVVWSEWLRLTRRAGCDPVWRRIAARRGYAFLRDREAVLMSWPVERMRIRYSRIEETTDDAPD